MLLIFFKLNAHAKNAAYCVAAVAAVAVPVYLVHDHVYVYVPLSGAIIDYVAWCDAECAREAETYRSDYSVRCVEVEDDRFVCRPERGFGMPLWPEECRHERCHDECGSEWWCPGIEVSRMLVVTPVTYGEIVTLLTGVKGEGFFDIAHADVIDAQEKRISVDFRSAWSESSDIAHTAQMVPGATFLVSCEAERTPHLVTYTDLYVSGNSTYAEFWGIHPAWAHSDPRPCDLAETVDRTLKIDYDIDLPGYDEFGFQP